MKTVKEIAAAWLEEHTNIERTILAYLEEHGEGYSREFFCATRATGGDLDQRRALPVIQNVLIAMERSGELTSRLVSPEEHRGSQLQRRYYRRAKK